MEQEQKLSEEFDPPPIPDSLLDFTSPPHDAFREPALRWPDIEIFQFFENDLVPIQEPYKGRFQVMSPKAIYDPDIWQARLPLPMSLGEAPRYVNPKQFYRILKLREKRASRGWRRIDRHKREARVLHAKRRGRGPKGRFESKSAKPVQESIASK